MVATLSGIGLGFLALGFLFQTYARPIVGLTTLTLVFIVYLGRMFPVAAAGELRRFSHRWDPVLGLRDRAHWRRSVGPVGVYAPRLALGETWQALCGSALAVPIDQITRRQRIELGGFRKARSGRHVVELVFRYVDECRVVTVGAPVCGDTGPHDAGADDSQTSELHRRSLLDLLRSSRYNAPRSRREGSCPASPSCQVCI